MTDTPATARGFISRQTLFQVAMMGGVSLLVAVACWTASTLDGMRSDVTRLTATMPAVEQRLTRVEHWIDAEEAGAPHR